MSQSSRASPGNCLSVFCQHSIIDSLWWWQESFSGPLRLNILRTNAVSIKPIPVKFTIIIGMKDQLLKFLELVLPKGINIPVLAFQQKIISIIYFLIPKINASQGKVLSKHRLSSLIVNFLDQHIVSSTLVICFLFSDTIS